MSVTRVLDDAALVRRVMALDALYLNADRRRSELQVLDFHADPDTWRRAYGAWVCARREYEAVRDTHYRLAREETQP